MATLRTLAPKLALTWVNPAPARAAALIWVNPSRGHEDYGEIAVTERPGAPGSTLGSELPFAARLESGADGHG